MFYMQIPPHLLHGLMTIDWLFLRLLNADFSCNRDEVLFRACKKVG